LNFDVLLVLADIGGRATDQAQKFGIAHFVRTGNSPFFHSQRLGAEHRPVKLLLPFYKRFVAPPGDVGQYGRHDGRDVQRPSRRAGKPAGAKFVAQREHGWV
jgi:hypothetical protein